MLFWVAIAIMLGAAVLLALWPLSRGGTTSDTADSEPFQHDIAVFKDQLDEIDRDLKRGVLNGSDAESARAEVSRRLLEANAQAEEAASSGNEKSSMLLARRTAAVFTFITIPAIAAVSYVMLGNPNMPDQPLLARLEAQQPSTDNSQVLNLVEQVETHLSSNPDDAEGWEVVAPVYQRLGRFDDAARAFENIIRLRGESERRLSDLGEAIVLSKEGVITNKAQGLFERATELAPRAIRPRFFLALGLNQESKFRDAMVAWENLLKEATPESAWAPGALDQLNLARNELELPPAEPMNAATEILSMSADEQTEMISSMVEGLATRLEDEPNNLPDWQRLIRSYVVLGRQGDAQAALENAIVIFEADQGARTTLGDLAKGLGLSVE